MTVREAWAGSMVRGISAVPTASALPMSRWLGGGGGEDDAGWVGGVEVAVLDELLDHGADVDGERARPG